MLWLWPPADCKQASSYGLAASYSFHIGVGSYGCSIGYCSQALLTTENKGPVSLQIISCGDKVISPIDKCC